MKSVLQSTSKTILLTAAMALSFSSAQADVKEHEVRKLFTSIVKQHIPACLDPRNFYDQVYCSSKVYGLMDDELNKEYKAVRKQLTKEQKQRLKKVQVSWIRSRDDNCAKKEGDSIVMNLGCSTKQTVESLYYLTAMKESPEQFDQLLQEYKERR